MPAVGKTMEAFLTSIFLFFMLPSASIEKECRYGREDILFGKFYKAATSTSRRLLKEVLKILFYKTHVITLESWPDNIEDFCFDVLGWSRKKYRDSFNAEERKYLASPLESLDGDVSLFNKLIIKLFDNVDLPGTFFNALRELKNIRNRVCHDQLDNFDEESLYTNMEDLKQIFSKLLQELRTTLGVDISIIELEYCDEVDEIVAAPVTGEGTSYFDKMERFREDLMGKFITIGRKELFAFYSKLKVLNPFTWLRDDKFSELQVDKIFTPLHISNKDILIDTDELLTTELYDEDSMDYTGVLPSVVIMKGIAGCGKTSLCRYLLHEWRTGLTNVSNLRSVDILILIEARNIVTNSLITFMKQNILKETCSHFEEKDILPTLQKLNVLYVVDGMDEATVNGRQVMDELFSVLGNSRVILTTRPEFSSLVVESAISHHLTFLQLRIHGFSDVGIAKFTSKVFKSLEDDERLREIQEKECLQFLMTTGKSLGQQLNIPLTLALMIILWRDEKSSLKKITSITRLYSEIFNMCSMKMLSRVKKFTSSSCLALEGFVEKWLVKLGQVAYEMIKKDEYVIPDDRRKMLTSFCNNYCIDGIQVLSAFLICEVHEDLDGVKYTFTFIHKSQMEYLAGLYHALMLKSEFEEASRNSSKNDIINPWLDELSVAKAESFMEIIRMRKMIDVYMFTIGHLCMKRPVVTDLAIKVTAKILSTPGMAKNVAALWRLTQESDKLPAIRQVVSSTISNTFIWQPEGEELCNPMDPTVQLVKNTDFTPLGIKLRIVGRREGILIKGENDNVELSPYTNLVSIFKYIEKRPKLNVVLRVDQHFYNWGDEETSDAYLQQFPPNSNLTGLMGHLGVDGAKSLSLFKNLEVLDARISSVDTLHTINESIDAIKRKDMEIRIRLDISDGVLPSSFPKLKSFPPFSIIMMNICDNRALWAAEVLTHLSMHYKEVDLMSSELTGDGGSVLLKFLSSKKVKVNEKISIHSLNRPDKKSLKHLQKLAKCRLQWW